MPPPTRRQWSRSPFNRSDTDADGLPDHWRILFTPDLARSLQTASATLYGNVCASTHGQTIAKEVLGDGDVSSTTYQTFQLQKSPVTFVHQAGAPHGVADTLQIQIAGVFWKEVRDFFGHTRRDRIFMTSQDAEGMIVQFGDGVTGGRLPTGRGNVVATFRPGIRPCRKCCVRRAAHSARPPRGTQERAQSQSGRWRRRSRVPRSDARQRSQHRAHLRTHGFTERLRDAAREFAGVAKAHAWSAWSGEEQVVCPAVAGDNGALITGNTYDELFGDLNARRDTNRSLTIRTYIPIFIKITALVVVRADHVSDDVVAAVQAAVVCQYYRLQTANSASPFTSATSIA